MLKGPLKGCLNMSKKVIAVSYTHLDVYKRQGPIRAVKYISNTRLVSAGNDRTLRLWKTKNDDLKLTSKQQAQEDDDDEVNIEDGKTLAILEGHKAPVVSIDVSDNSRILSCLLYTSRCV